MAQYEDVDDYDQNVQYAEADDYESGSEEGYEDEVVNDAYKDDHDEDGVEDGGDNDGNEDANAEGPVMSLSEAIVHFVVHKTKLCGYCRIASTSEANKRMHDKKRHGINYEGQLHVLPGEVYNLESGESHSNTNQFRKCLSSFGFDVPHGNRDEKTVTKEKPKRPERLLSVWRWASHQQDAA